MRKAFSILLCLIVLIGILPPEQVSAEKNEQIVILYENDVHCEVEGYSKLAALKKEYQQAYAHVGVVSSGDYIQGSSIGSISRGEYIIRLMNLVGYDGVALGNHEFDFELGRLNELVEKMQTKPVCCNFQKLDQDHSYFRPYSIVSYGDVQIAYIGITTPSTMRSTSASQYQDADGNFIYTFHANELDQVVQAQVDAARAEGADYVIALSHLGDQEPRYNADELIPLVEGIDVVLDAHSHSEIPGKVLKDRAGKDVLVSSTGTKFANVGKLTIGADGITTELIDLESYEKTDPEVDACLEQIYSEYEQQGERVVGYTEVELITHDKDGNRLVRNGETNLGDFLSDAYRVVSGADIGHMNGGGMRTSIEKGEITYNELLNVMPFQNQQVVLRVKGQDIWDMLELTTMSWPEEGSFPHMSGLTFCLNTAIESSVEVDENEMFVRVAGPYRVYGIKVLDRESGSYKPLDPEGYYTIAGQDHSLINGGSGITMFGDGELLLCGELDVELVERYITEHLDGVIGQQYAQVQTTITYTDGEIPEGLPFWQIALWVLLGLVILGAALWLLRRGKKRKR